MGVTLGRSAVVSDTGRRRRSNEDSYVCEPPLFAVADGMGGAQAGEVASGLAAAVLEEANGDELREERIVELIQEANRRVFKRSHEDPSASGMGTTMTVAVTGRDGAVLIGHVGDSRAYRIRGGSLEQLTKDHSLVGELMRSGKLSPEEAETHPQRSVITRAVGTEPDVDVDTFTVDAEAGDVFLLCSDGLTDMVSDSAIESLLAEREGELETVARSLVEAANSSGGEDNITVLVFEIVESGSGADDTVAMPAAATKLSAADDEDTLSGLEAVPRGRHRGRLRCGHRGASRGHGRAADADAGDDARAADDRAAGRACSGSRTEAEPGAAPAARASSWWRSPSSSSGGSTADCAQPRAAQPGRGRSSHSDRLRERLHREAGRRLDGVARLRGPSSWRCTSSRTSSRATRCRTPIRTCCRWPRCSRRSG